ncbi:rRNA bioproteinsis protein rrp36 [Neopestalotiopsis sp. 37M]|nr:rRNA bioproteinsis protein rrp36 [Neopestalotiopsis sp. 37M]
MNRPQQPKRKFPFSGLQRRVRARKDEPEPDLEEDYESQPSQDEDQDDDDASDDSQDQDGASMSGSAMDEDDEDEDDDSDDGEPSNPSLAASQISFGALAKAQASLPAVSRRKHKKPGEAESGDEGNDSDSDSSPEEFDRHGKSKIKPVAGRAHKHAPAEMTSKKPVTRRRQVVDAAGVPSKPSARDPRFGPPLHSTAADAERAQDALRRNYAFLGAYRDSEMSALRTRIKKTKDPFEKQRLERELASMQSRKQAQERRDAERHVIEEHRKKEKELVAQGVKSQPFYLKKSEQRKRVLTDRFQGMKKRQVDKAIVRRRKKEVAKERKELPMERRAR